MGGPEFAAALALDTLLPMELESDSWLVSCPPMPFCEDGVGEASRICNGHNGDDGSFAVAQSGFQQLTTVSSGTIVFEAD